jgi:arylsulfatase A-like enzyme
MSVFDRVRKTVQTLPEVSVATLLVVAGWCGILFGLAEGANAAIRRRIHHVPTGEYTWTELLWMAPLAASVALLAVALIAILLDRMVRARGALLRLASPFIVALAVYSLIRSLRPGIAGYAVAVLALGCAVAFARISSSRLQRVARAARWQIPVATAALFVWGIGVPRYRQFQERRARAALPVAAQGAPNVLLIIWDTARAMSLSLYGHTRETTPQLEAFAKGGAVFDRAFATSSWSLPSHASMYTGREAHEIRINRDIPLDGTFPTLGEVLSRHGYATAGFTGNLFYGSRDYGIARGFAWYDDEAPPSPSKLATTWTLTRRVLAPWRRWRGNHQEIVRRPGDDVRSKLLAWIDRRGSLPFFASVNFFDAHEPYLAPDPAFNRHFSPTPLRYWEGDVRPTDPKVLSDLQTAYESCIRYVDHELGLLLDALRQRGLLENTLVIVTADHGDQFGDHGAHLLGHERSLYSSVLRIPLVLVYPPRVPAGVRRDAVVSLRDIPATIIDALGLPETNVFPGISLLRYASGTATETEIATPRFAHLDPNKFYPAEMDWANKQQHRIGVMSGTLQYLVNASAQEELYDFVHDPWETRDLKNDSSAALNRFRAIVDSVLPDSMRPKAPRDSLPNR